MIPPMTKLITVASARINLKSITALLFVSLALIWNEPVWTWVNGDEEEDTVRFRQRLVFVVCLMLFVGLFQVKNTYSK